VLSFRKESSAKKMMTRSKKRYPSLDVNTKIDTRVFEKKRKEEVNRKLLF